MALIICRTVFAGCRRRRRPRLNSGQSRPSFLFGRESNVVQIYIYSAVHDRPKIFENGLYSTWYYRGGTVRYACAL